MCRLASITIAAASFLTACAELQPFLPDRMPVGGPGIVVAGEINRVGDSAGFRTLDPPKAFCVVIAIDATKPGQPLGRANAMLYTGAIRNVFGIVSGVPFRFKPWANDPAGSNTVALSKDVETAAPGGIVALRTASDPARRPATKVEIAGGRQAIRIETRLVKTDSGTVYEGMITGTAPDCGLTAAWINAK